MENPEILYLVIPCYNEEEVLPETSKRLLEKMNTMIQNNLINNKSKIVFVDDGSKDKTWEIIESLHNENDIFSGVKLSRNKGHQNALMAGLMTVKDLADMVISLDADLQDDINAIDKFAEKYYEGSDIVYGIRSSREKDTFFKKSSALAFYKLMLLMGVDVLYNHADYRLMSRRALNELANFKEVNLFLRGIIPLIGFKSATVEYERNERFAGESKYPFRKMLSFAADGITSFSVKPIKLVLALGVAMLFVSFIMLIYTIVVKIMGYAEAGWAFIICSIWLVAGVQMLSLGIIGEYVGKIYSEVKARPKFIVEKFVNKE
ncbi:MAG: glycosyltransferase family 2 protein [Firmicutes bacterium]|nr:glycosyltransferase family 2 protein [Bacillota bacterium]